MWKTALLDYKLPLGQAHIWRANLDIEPELRAFFEVTLSPDERQRAYRFYFEKDRLHFIAARGVLRQLLGRYLQKDPKDIVFSYTSYGKPFLVDYTCLQFNISHSKGYALFGIVQEFPIGIDLEFIRPKIEFERLAKRFFSPNETQALLKLSATERYHGFFNCWTRKEAFIKAKGEGLSLPLDQFEVSLVPNTPAKLMATHWNPLEAADWHLHELFPQTNFVGALAVKGKVETKLFDF